MLPPICNICPQPQQADFCAACPAPPDWSWLILIVDGCNENITDIQLEGEIRELRGEETTNALKY